MLTLLDKIRLFFIWKTLQRRSAHPIYIIPTVDGLKVLSLNFLLLIIGLIYANNYVLLFNFILFCVVLGSMFYTHYNLKGLNLLFAGISDGFEKESNHLKLSFTSRNPNGHDRLEVEPFHYDLISFSNDEFSYKNHNPIDTHEMNLTFRNRGQKKLQYICVSTKFPLSFFKAFTYFKIECSFYNFPERANHHIPILCESQGQIDDSDDTELKEYKIGDPLRRVDWKKLAKSNIWYTKAFSGHDFKQIYFNIDSDYENKENLLKQVSYSISTAEVNNLEYGLKINKQIVIEAGKGSLHQENCLRFISDL